MRKFVVSDIHGNGEVYDSIIAYLENISREEQVELYINGDLIDRGMDSFRLLVDVKKRTSGYGKIKVHYLAGNHEWLMYDYYKDYLKKGKFDQWHPWNDSLTGGYFISGELEDTLSLEESLEYYKYIGTLPIYHCFPEKINEKNILLVHSMPPSDIKENSVLRLKDETEEVFNCLWKREEEYAPGIFSRGPLIGYNDLGKDGYFIIRGHTPVKDAPFKYNQQQNWLNIDGGCTNYAFGDFDVDHVPLVEIKDNQLEIIIFNHNNEITDGYYFNGDTIKMSQEELAKKRLNLNHQFDNCAEPIKKLIKELNEL